MVDLKSMNIVKKLNLSYVAIAGLIALIVFIGWFSLFIYAQKVDSLQAMEDLRGVMSQKDIEHLHWRNTISDFLLDEGAQSLDVLTEYEKCTLKDWLFSAERVKAEALIPEITPLLTQLEGSQQALQDAAAEIQKVVRDNKNNPAVMKEECRKVFTARTIKNIESAGQILNSIDNRLVEEVNLRKTAVRRLAVILGVLMLLITFLGGFGMFKFSRIIAREISLSIRQVMDFASTMATGDISRLFSTNRKDEMSQIGLKLNEISTSFSSIIAGMLRELVSLSSSSNELTTISGVLSQNAGDVADKATNLSENTNEMASNMNSVAAASEEASTNLSVMAGNSEMLVESIHAVDVKAKEAKNITSNALNLVQSSTSKVDALNHAAEEIDKVTLVINDISDQTNLLALNATIEAARAGEAGKGFTVVAKEIKDLANQTMHATDEIRQSIESMQNSTNETVSEIKDISLVMERIGQIVDEIAQAVEAQSTSTSEISDNIRQAALGIEEVNKNVSRSSSFSEQIARDIQDVSRRAMELSGSSQDVDSNSSDLGRLAETLKVMAEKFSISEASITTAQKSGNETTARDLIRWSSSYMLGIQEIDEQHMKLVEIINDLHKGMKMGKSQLEMARILNRLLEYTGFHFGTEEQYFEKFKYPETIKHKGIHGNLVKQVVDFKTQFESGNATISIELMSFLKDWLINHIQGEDRKYAPLFKSMGM